MMPLSKLPAYQAKTISGNGALSKNPITMEGSSGTVLPTPTSQNLISQLLFIIPH
jgi:hypothetical protein